MFRFIHKTSIPVLVLIIFGLQSVLLTPDGYAQGLMKTADVPEEEEEDHQTSQMIRGEEVQHCSLSAG